MEEELSTPQFDDWYDAALKKGQGFKSEEEKKAYFDAIGDPLKHPLFAGSTEDMADHPLVDALRLIKEEDKSTLELAEMYKNEGNEWIKKPKKEDKYAAIDCYNRALDFLTTARSESKDPTDADIDIDKLQSQIISNRCLVQLQLKNYGVAIKEADLALLSVKRYDDCIAAVDTATSLGVDGIPELQQMAQQCRAELSRLQTLHESTTQKRNELAALFAQSWDAATKLGARFGPAPSNWRPPVQLKYHYPHIQDGEVSFPVTFLYPQYNQIDVIQGVSVDDLLVEHLAQMFPEEDVGAVPWDQSNEYHISQLVVYFMQSTSEPFATREQWIEYQLSISNNPDAITETSVDFNYTNKQYKNHMKIVEAHLACSFKSIISAPNHIIDGGLLTMLVLVRHNEAHKRFLKNYDDKVMLLIPSGEVVDPALAEMQEAEHSNKKVILYVQSVPHRPAPNSLRISATLS